MTIFITVKGTSVRCPDKNKILLPFTLKKITDNVIVITDSLEIVEICKEFNVKYFIEDKQTQKCELKSIYDFIVNTNQIDSIEEFVHLQVTHPLCNIETIMEVINYKMENYDMITTFTYVPNRKIFLLNDDDTYMYDSYERKGSLCKPTKMIDGSVYKIKTTFLKKVIDSDNVNHTFWNKSKKKFIQNKTNIFLDVDESYELDLFQKYFNKEQ